HGPAGPGTRPLERRRALGDLCRLGGERDEDEFPAVRAERRKKGCERRGVADDRATRLWTGDGSAQPGVLAEDRALELLQGRARLDPEFVNQHRAALAVAGERFVLTSAAIE